VIEYQYVDDEFEHVISNPMTGETVALTDEAVACRP